MRGSFKKTKRMSEQKTDNNGKITDKTIVSLPLKLVVIILFMALSAVAGYKFNQVDDSIKEVRDKKLDKEEFYRANFRDSLEKSEVNRKLDLLLRHFDIEFSIKHKRK